MTLTTWKVFSAMNNTAFFWIEWDSPMWKTDWENDPTGETDIMQDPGATYLVHSITYQNLDTKTWYLDISNRTYSAPPGTSQRTIAISPGQRFRIDEAPVLTFRPS